MSDLFTTAPAEPEPALAPVVQLHPDGVRVRTETRTTEGGNEFAIYWVERWRGTRSTVAVMYDVDELRQLRDAIDRVLP